MPTTCRMCGCRSTILATGHRYCDPCADEIRELMDEWDQVVRDEDEWARDFECHRAERGALEEGDDEC